jgi:membrane protease YdiL (CAAX protease family)
MKVYHRIIQLASWLLLFFIQVNFNVNPTNNEWFRISVLLIYILIVSTAWIRLVERKSLSERLNFNQSTLVLFTYSISSSIVVLFIKQDFGIAALVAGGSIILPIFEELYFRAFLLGSVSFSWPKVQVMDANDRKVFLREGLAYLVFTSLGFALVHDDVIQSLLANGFMNLNYTIFFLRFFFGFTIGGLYYYSRNFIITSVFHIIYNLTYLIAHF